MIRIANAPLAVFFCALSFAAAAQTPATDASAPPLPPPHGTVLFERNTDTGTTEALPPAAQAAAEPAQSATALSDEERAATVITAWDLDARMTPASSQLEMRAKITLRNASAVPLSRIALQISSTLMWQSATLLDTPRTRLAVVQHPLDTDADHTGKSNELVLTLPAPLAPGASLSLDTLYAGVIAASGERLERIGASHEKALDADWDTIDTKGIALRGFGDVLWYPVAAPQYFLGDGNALFQAIGRARLRDEAATVRLHLAISFSGDAPAAVYFCGRRVALTALSDNSDAPAAVGIGIATADFSAETLGFRPISLFVVERSEQRIAPLSANASEDLLAVVTEDDRALPRLADAAVSLAPLLQRWFGPHPLSALAVIDRNGQPFEDGPLLVAPVATIAGSTAAPALAHSLTHAFIQTGQPWMDEGLAQFLALLVTEQQQGRDVAEGALKELLRPVTLSEPEPAALSEESSGQPLIVAYDELYYRRKAAAVWWVLRSLAGDEALQIALATWSSQPASHDPPRAQAIAFQHLLERVSRQENKEIDLGWFFNDWVLRDRGLPDLSIVAVEPRPLPAGKGHDSGWLVAVTVRNDGAAAAQVPLILSSGNRSLTKPMRIPGLSTVTERVVLQSAPTQVQINDGSMPEMRDWQHKINVTVQVRP